MLVRSGKKYKNCHMPIDEKIQLHADRGEIVPSRAILKTPAQIEMIRKSADLNTAVLDEVAKHIRIGMSTAEIDEICLPFHNGAWRNPGTSELSGLSEKRMHLTE